MVDFSTLVLLLSFFLTTTIYIILRSSQKHEIKQFNDLVSKFQDLRFWILLKVIPICIVLLLALLLISERNEIAKFFIIIGLVFCLLGDIGIEYKFLHGMLFFSIAHINFILAFIISFLVYPFIFETIPMAIYIIIGLVLVVFNVIFLNFHTHTGKLGSYKLFIQVYSILISGMFFLACGLVYLLNLGSLAYLIALGAFLFILSDTIIALREFHTIKLKYSVVMIMSTYYSAILLISTAVIIL